MTSLGFHFFPDTLHYRQADMDAWLPELTAMRANWLVLQAKTTRAIPEMFIRTLQSHKITPILQFQTELTTASPNLFEMRPQLEAYADWGVNYVQFFHQPNQRASWPAAGWMQQNLVDRFLDIWLPYANLAVAAGLTPVLPPLQPGGSYWDTAFLRSTFQSMQRRKCKTVIEKLTLSAYGWTDGRPLDWGLGGPHAWQQSRPYHTPANSQDQRGFRIFDWYLAIAEEELNRTPGLILYQAGLPAAPQELLNAPIDPEIYQPDMLAISYLACGEQVGLPGTSVPIAPLPDDVIACCMWLLAADAHSPYLPQAWYSADGQPGVLAQKWLETRPRQAKTSKAIPQQGEPIFDHYLLLPTFQWGVADWHLDVIRPYIKKERPTIGFSLQEAALARRVTVIGNDEAFPPESLQALRTAGCVVEQISESGMDFATRPVER